MIFKSQGGLDFELNYKDLSSEDHRGDFGPHKCREVDLIYKKELEEELRQLLVDERYLLDEMIQLLGLNNKQAQKAFKRVSQTIEGIEKEDIIFRLMGGRFYL